MPNNSRKISTTVGKSSLKIAVLGASMTLSDSFAIKSAVLPFLLSRLNQDSEHVAAIALILTMLDSLIITSASPLFYLSIAGSQKRDALAKIEPEAEQDRQLQQGKINVLFRDGILYSLAVTPILSSGFYFSGSILTKVFRQQPSIAGFSQDILRPSALSVPSLLYCTVANQIFQIFQDKNAMNFGTLSLLLSLAAQFGLVLGAPSFGNQGILVPYIAETYLTGLVSSYFLLRPSKYREYPFFKGLLQLKQAWRPLLELVKNGAAITFTVAADMALGFGVSALAGYKGVKQQQALATTMQYTAVNGIFAIHFSLASMQILGNVLETRDKQLIYPTASAGLMTSAAIGSLLPIFFAARPDLLLALLGNQDESLADILETLAPIISVGSICNFFRFTLMFQLRRMGDMRGSTLISSGSAIMGIILATILCFQKQSDVNWLASAYSLSMFISMALLAYRWQGQLKQAVEPKLSQFSLFAATPGEAIREKKADLQEEIAEWLQQLDNLENPVESAFLKTSLQILQTQIQIAQSEANLAPIETSYERLLPRLQRLFLRVGAPDRRTGSLAIFIV